MSIPIEINKSCIITDDNIIEEPETREPKSDFHFQVRGEDARRQRDEDTTYTRTEQVDLSRLKKNTFVDDGSGRDSDEVREKLYPKSRAPRRQKFEYTKINCEGCGKECKVHPVHIRNKKYTCDKCIMNKGG